MSRTRTIVMALGLAAATVTIAHSQATDHTDIDCDMRAGAQAGSALTWQTGGFKIGSLPFSDGTGTNIVAGGGVDLPLGDEGSSLRFETSVGFLGRKVQASYDSHEMIIVRTSGTSAPDSTLVPADFKHIGEANLSCITFAPSVKYYPVEWFYVGLGANLGMAITTTKQHRKEILSRVVETEHGLVEVYYSSEESADKYLRTFPVREFTSALKFSIDGILYAGAEIHLTDAMAISPRVSYAQPITAVASDPDMWLHSVQCTVGFWMNL